MSDPLRIADNLGRRLNDNLNPVNRFARIFDRYGFAAGIAAALIYFIASIVLVRLDHIQADMHDHVFRSGYYQEISCRNLAILAGRPLADCTPPPTPEQTGAFEREKK
jgi:hypothetical protein